MTTARPNYSLSFVSCISCLFVGFIACPAKTAVAESIPVNNGNFIGAHVTYFDVTQNSLDPIPLGEPGPYGMPEIEDNDLSFHAPSFAAIADLNRLQDITDGFLGFRMKADEGYAMSELALFEFGAIEFHSASGGSTDTWTNIVAPIYIEVKKIVVSDGTPAGRIMNVPEPMLFSTQVPITPQGVSPPGWNSLDDPDATKWLAVLEIDLVAEIASAFPDMFAQEDVQGVADLTLTMNNILTAGVEDLNSLAFIDKKYAGFRPLVMPISVPEPTRCAGELAFLGLALGGIVVRRRRATPSSIFDL